MTRRPLRLRLALVLVPLVLVPACTTPAARSGGESAATSQVAAGPERGYDVEHYAIDLQLFPDERRIQGTCRVRLVPTEEGLEDVVLDLEGLIVTTVRDGAGHELSFTQAQDLLHVHPAEPLPSGQPYEISVLYGGVPRTGLWFSGHRPDGTGPNQVFTQGEAEQSRGWFPCYDHPSDRATSEVTVTMPAGWRSVAPGALIDRHEDPQQDTVTEHWRMDTPHASYLTSLVAGEFEVHQSDWKGVPLMVVAEPKYDGWIEASFDDTDDILQFYSDYTGVHYPYPKYSQAAVANFPWGGMENISATTLTPLTLTDERGHRDQESEPLVAHEAAHQWFGDLLTCRTWKDIWLNEGFATYMELLYTEHAHGEDEFRARMREAQDRYVESCRGAKYRPIVWGQYKEPEDLFDEHPYQGAASRLHLLRFLLGDDVFHEGIRTYVAENQGRDVTTADFRRVMEKVSGKDLAGFFDQWLMRPGNPEFEVSWDWNERKSSVGLTVKETQDGPLFTLPVLIEIKDKTGTTQHRIDVTRRLETFYFTAAAKPDFVRFDKYSWIPKAITWKRSPTEWMAIASSDDDVTGRRDAMLALGKLAAQDRDKIPEAHETYVIALVGALRHDSSEWVRTAAATALGQAGGSEARARLEAAAKEDESAKVRTAALQSLAGWGPDRSLAELGRAVFEDGYSWDVMGAAAGLVCAADPDGAHAWLVDKLHVDSPHDRLASLLLQHLGGLKDRAVDQELQLWMNDETLDPTARGVAVQQLARRDGHLPATLREIGKLLGADNFRLRLAVLHALADTGDGLAREILRDYYPKAVTADERRTIEAAMVGQRH